MENLTTAQPQLRKKKLRTNNNFIDRGMNISTVQKKKIIISSLGILHYKIIKDNFITLNTD